jgi:chemotaxis signal transduction protein
MPARGRQLVRVDPAALLGLKAEPEKPAYLLVLDSGRYALEVSAMEQPLSLPAGEIRWRAAGAGKDWALGMLPEQMCILLDADAIDARLAGAEGQAR